MTDELTDISSRREARTHLKKVGRHHSAVSFLSESAHALMLLGAGELVARVMAHIFPFDQRYTRILAVANELALSLTLFLFVIGNKHLSLIFLP